MTRLTEWLVEVGLEQATPRHDTTTLHISPKGLILGVTDGQFRTVHLEMVNLGTTA